MAASERRHLLPSSLRPTFAQGCPLSAWPQKALAGESLHWRSRPPRSRPLQCPLCYPALSGAPSVSLSCPTRADPGRQPSVLLGKSCALVLLYHRWRWKNWEAESWLGLCWHIPACWVLGVALSAVAHGSGPAVLRSAPVSLELSLTTAWSRGQRFFFFPLVFKLLLENCGASS